MADTTLDERFMELRRSVDAEIAGARRAVIEALTRGVARMRAASNEVEWSDAVLESGRPFADDPAALELLASLAALTAPSAALTAPSSQGQTSFVGSGDLGAQRFAKVKIAEIQLYQAEAVKSGRAARDLYGSLKPQVDAAREAFQGRFLTPGGGSVDYLHAELVRALANDDATLLGPGYPGPLE